MREYKQETILPGEEEEVLVKKAKVKSWQPTELAYIEEYAKISDMSATEKIQELQDLLDRSEGSVRTKFYQVLKDIENGQDPKLQFKRKKQPRIQPPNKPKSLAHRLKMIIAELNEVLAEVEPLEKWTAEALGIKKRLSYYVDRDGSVSDLQVKDEE